jgi:hypothetical protein
VQPEQKGTRTRTYTTGLVPADPETLRGLAWDVERWQRDQGGVARDLEARICAALLSHHGWEYVPPRPYVPARKEGRKIVERERPPVGPRIARSYRYDSGCGSEESPAPQILTDIGQAFGLLHGRVLLHLSDIGADGLPYAHVAGGERSAMGAEGKAMGGATLAATLVAAVLRCEAMDRETRHAA